MAVREPDDALAFRETNVDLACPPFAEQAPGTIDRPP